MGSTLGRHQKEYSGAGTVPELQQKILHHIFLDGENTWDFSDVLKGCQKFGFTSLEHLIQDIPPDILKHHYSDRIKNDHHISGVGSRFVLRNDPGIRGSCTEIRITSGSESPSYTTFIKMRLDQPKNGRVEPPLQVIHPVNDLLLEKHYLQEIIKAKCFETQEPARKEVSSSTNSKQKLLTNSNPKTTKSSTPSKKKKRNSRVEHDQTTTEQPEKFAPSKAEESIPSSFSHQRFDDFDSDQIKIAPKLYSVVVSEPAKISTKSVKKTPLSPLISRVLSPSLTGKKRGIHGANNSCYMDSLFFSLFYNTTQFNDVFLKGKDKDSNDAKELRRVLVESVVAPLSTELYCSPSSMGILRGFLSKFDDRYQGAMMDIEELVYQMLEEILDEPHFLQYNNGTKEYIHQILTDAEADKDESGNDKLRIVDLQTCLESSFKLWGGLKLLQCPNPAFIIQFPRSDGELIQYDGILPNPILNLESVYANYPNPCSMCQVGLGEWECGTCKNSESTTDCQSYCSGCITNKKIDCEHSVNSLRSRTVLELQSIICINSAHYTAIVKSFENSKSQSHQWLHFDSMAGAYPEVILLNNFETKLRQTEMFIKNGEYNSNLSSLNKWVYKAMRDCHICIYLPTQWHRSES